MSKDGSTVDLTIGDRINVSNLLPAKDTFERLIIREGILDKVKLTAKEVADYEIKTDVTSGAITWNDGTAKFKYNFTTQETDLIKESLKSLSDKGELGADMVNIYREFVT